MSDKGHKSGVDQLWRIFQEMNGKKGSEIPALAHDDCSPHEFRLNPGKGKASHYVKFQQILRPPYMNHAKLSVSDSPASRSDDHESVFLTVSVHQIPGQKVKCLFAFIGAPAIGHDMCQPWVSTCTAIFMLANKLCC